jgi:hypothetical protein
MIRASRSWLPLCLLLLSFAIPRQALAAGTYKFCLGWNYTFIDEGLGEDKLLHWASSGTYGGKVAAYAYSVLYRDGVQLWSGLLDSGGCTPMVTASAGTYEVYTTTDIEPPGGPKILITPTSTHEWRWYWAGFGYMPARTDQTGYNAYFGPGDALINVAAAALELLARPDNGLVSGQEYWVSAESTTPTATGGAVSLGWNMQFSQWDAFFKSVILHEMGLLIQYKAFGIQAHDYEASLNPAPPPVCACGSVYDPADRKHCIQSLEETGAAQIEGFGHFVAAATLNSVTQNPGWFPYYKNYWAPQGYVVEPPIAFATVPWHWMRDRCPASNGGVELDWMAFLYGLTRNASASKYSFNDIAATYRRTCTGSNTTNCSTSNATPWAGLVNSAKRYTA